MKAFEFDHRLIDSYARFSRSFSTIRPDDLKTEINNRLLGVSIHSYSHENIHSVKELAPSMLKQLEEFFVSYNKLHGKKFKVTNVGGPKRALALIRQGIKAFEDKKAS